MYSPPPPNVCIKGTVQHYAAIIKSINKYINGMALV